MKPRIADLEGWYDDDHSDSYEFFDLMEPAGPLLLRLARAAKAVDAYAQGEQADAHAVYTELREALYAFDWDDDVEVDDGTHTKSKA